MSGQATPTRVAILIGSDGPGGAEMMVFRLALELRARGCTVVPVLPAGGYGWLGGLLREAGFEPEEIAMSTRWFDAATVRALLEIFRRHRINVVHSHEFDFTVLGTAAARLARIPHVFTLHGGLTSTATFKRRFALRWATRLSAAAVMVSAPTRDKFAAELGVRPGAFTVIPNGVAVTAGDAGRVRQEFACSDDETVVLAVGTLERNKGHHVLLEALERLAHTETANPWRLIIAGGRGGDQHQALLESIAERGLDGRVHIVTNRNDIADLQALADIFVMPSFFEGLPMALLEAMVAGNAIVASRTGGIPDALVHNVEGLLVPPGDAQALADALAALLGNREERARLGASARTRASREFTADVMAARYHELFNRLR